MSCSNTELLNELEQLKADFADAQDTIEKLSFDSNKKGSLVHLVFFKTKDDIDQNAFMTELRKLASIDIVRDFRLGPFIELEDPRALSEYPIFMQMSFESKNDYLDYQKHPVHLSLKQKTQKYMAGPPATYDFFVK